MVRRRVEIKKIEDRSKRQVTFSKRRKGLFKKANELCQKCDAEAAVIAISMAGNIYAFGHPTFDSVVKRYKEEKSSPRLGPGLDGNNKANMGLDLSLASHAGSKNQIPREKKSEKGLVLKNKNKQEVERKLIPDLALWDLPVDDLGLDELQQLMIGMEEMRKKVIDRVNYIQEQEEQYTCVQGEQRVGDFKFGTIYGRLEQYVGDFV